ncbi:hypothetical protein GALMADRAFT_225966 [Galerina marginata CBS 339.88]|uniref:DNA 3'-5' helicase n=1 Tax=Galerina marginata (strain CBS 339.88) TaxID=685588 RepID=A0A067TB97_GALM3|nr:hypothetical protein GALMADRAFT_225966 [Galerina marginata CBS 339.88]
MNTPGPSRANATAQPDSSSTAIDLGSVLNGLNAAQLRAVEHDPTIPLQILAGPGSGKTKVLTCRIARLIITHKLQPATICAVTFTNKAANEMRDRLTKLIGKVKTTALQMGTFHSICARYLRMHPAEVGLDGNFTICDADESKKLIGALMDPYSDYMMKHDITLSEGNAASAISKAKAKGQSAAMMHAEVEKNEALSKRHLPPQPPGSEERKGVQRILAEVYIGYEKVLKENSALDFDDLLIYGVKLFTTHQESVIWCRHILVDEFQDTNTMQYELMKAIAVRRCLTIVGDPDQSIYGWRSAEVINLSRMRKDFPNTEQIFLEQNYRSTASILRSCLAIVAEDKKRIPKSLHTSHPLGATPFIGKFENEKDEADFIADEIKRCTANMGGVLKWGDFVILLRFNALSRPIESALQKCGIPCRILGGHKFFERMEVKDLLAYLQLADNPSFNPAFIRAVKVPARGMGDKSLSEVASQAQRLKISQLELVEKIYDNKVPDIKPSVKKKIVSFVKTIRSLRKLDEDKCSPSDMLRKLVDMINYEDHLKKTQQDWESRWENVQELITFASEVEAEAQKQKTQPAEGPSNAVIEERSVLRDFLQASMLSSEGDNETEDESKEKVTLSTCHAAKGLEWPVVMIPAVDQDTFPFYRTEDIDEERRLLYVACTRAQALLYILHSKKRMVGGKTKEKKLSDFVSVVRGKNEGFFSYDVPRFLPGDRSVISSVLTRPLPDEAEIERRLAELELSGDRVKPLFQNPYGEMSTMSLKGVKSSIATAPLEPANLAALYAAPDALASISATFMKDYKKKGPFSKRPKPPSKPNTFNTSFTPSSGIFMHSIQSGVTTYSSTTDDDFEMSFQPQIAESSRQGSSYIRPAGKPQPTRQSQTLQRSRSPSKTSAVNEAYLISTPPPKSALPFRPPGTNPAPSYSSVTPDSRNHADKPASSSPNSGRSSNRLVMNSSSQANQGNDSPSLLSRTPISKVSSSVPIALSSSYDQVRPPGECSSGLKSSALSRVLVGQDDFYSDYYDTGMTSFPEPTASSVLSSQPKAPHFPCPSLVSDLPTARNIVPRIEPSGASQGSPKASAPQAFGVKRRLGMGRLTTGYSNKKFKNLV